MKVTDKITITNEDNMELMALYPDNHFDLAIVDPPYGLGDSVVNSGGRFKRYENKNGNWDNEIPTDDYFNELFRISKNQIIWGGNYFYLNPTKCFLIWDKKQPQDVSFASCEFAWTSFNSVAKTFYYRPQGQENRFHPTQKPVALYKWILDKYAKEGDKILDTHLGSGSIAIACHDYGYELTACELDKEYFDKAIERITNHTSQQKLF
jgi:site-specific DNA-methyltransferase (adenine-specific)